eukprot:scaffold1330_cov240-Pinguiococcus_pyrenoidosus.AAC.18
MNLRPLLLQLLASLQVGHVPGNVGIGGTVHLVHRLDEGDLEVPHRNDQHHDDDEDDRDEDGAPALLVGSCHVAILLHERHDQQ